MNRRTLVAGGGVLVVLAVAGYGLYSAGFHAATGASQGARSESPAAVLKPGDIDPQTGKRILYWQDPMSPGQRFDHAGQSPYMDMKLVPVEESAEDTGAVSINPRVEQNLGVRIAEVTRSRLPAALSAVASVAYDERNVDLVQARANGYVERLFVRATLDPVRKGEPLADLYVPDWVAAQEEYLYVRNLKSDAAAGLLDGARQRLRLSGMTEDQIARFERSGKLEPRLTITAPMEGVVSELSAREGMTVTSGSPLFRINGLATVWVNAEVPESLARLVHAGDAVKARAAALPGSVFEGRVGAVLPEVNPMTRTLKVRIELANPERRLTPGMFMSVHFAEVPAQEVLLVPSEAIIETGTRRVVVLAQGDGKFKPVSVEIGAEAGGQTEIRSGLSEHQQVVVSGQFLIDSEASLKATEARLQ